MDPRQPLIDRNGRSGGPRTGHSARCYRREFLIANERLELLSTQTKQSATPESNRKWMPVCRRTNYEQRRSSDFSREREARERVTYEVHNRLRNFELLLRLDWLTRQRAAGAAASAPASATPTASARAAAAARSTASA